MISWISLTAEEARSVRDGQLADFYTTMEDSTSVLYLSAGSAAKDSRTGGCSHLMILITHEGSLAYRRLRAGLARETGQPGAWA